MGCSFKNKKGKSIVNVFKKSLKEPNKIWVEKGREFYKCSFKKWLQEIDIAMYSIHNEGKSVIAERFIRTLRNKIYKYMISISKMCILINYSEYIVNEYNKTYHRKIKMKPIDVKDNKSMIKILSLELVIM